MISRDRTEISRRLKSVALSLWPKVDRIVIDFIQDAPNSKVSCYIDWNGVQMTASDVDPIEALIQIVENKHIESTGVDPEAMIEQTEILDPVFGMFNLQKHLNDYEEQIIRKAVLKSKNVNQAAKLLGLRRTTLSERLRKYRQQGVGWAMEWDRSKQRARE